MHLGDDRPIYAKRGMIWGKKVYGLSGYHSVDLFWDTGEEGVPIGRFSLSSKRLSLHWSVVFNNQPFVTTSAMNSAIGSAISSAISGSITNKINSLISAAINGAINSNILNAIAANVRNLTQAQALDEGSNVFGMISGDLLEKAIAANASSKPHAIFEYQLADGAAGPIHSANQDRLLGLNAIRVNDLAGVSLSGGRINGRAAGSYYIEAEAVLRADGDNGTQSWIHNVTANSKAILGTRSESDWAGVTSTVSGVLTLGTTSSIELRARASRYFWNGSGRSYSFGMTPISNRVKIWKV
jgi:hypothetical protein